MTTARTPAEPRIRLARLPQLRRWITVPLLLVLATLTLGFTVKRIPGLAATEFRADQLLSRHHNVVGDAIAVTINTVLSPPGISLILLVMFVFLLFVPRSVVNAVALCSVATAAIVFYAGLWNRYGLRVLNRIPFIDRIGPVSPASRPGGGRPATGRPALDTH
jgi:ABC-type methionine transport system permease subunit